MIVFKAAKFYCSGAQDEGGAYAEGGVQLGWFEGAAKDHVYARATP